MEIVNNVNQNGLGFGINISKKLITKLGGEIFIENNLNIENCELSNGVTVTLEFPTFIKDEDERNFSRSNSESNKIN